MDIIKKTGRFVEGNTAALVDRYRRETDAETIRACAADFEVLEARLNTMRAAREAKVAAFLKSLEADARAEGRLESELSRSRRCRHYEVDPVAFQGLGETPGEVAERKYYEVRELLVEAQKQLEGTPEPSFTLAEALSDSRRHELWERYTKARDLVAELSAQEAKARKTAEGLGRHVQPLNTGGSVPGDPFKDRRVSERRIVAEMAGI